MTLGHLAHPVLNRRELLAWSGALLGLPLLPDLATARDGGRAFNRAHGRVVFVYTPNGLIEETFRPASAGALPEDLPATLSPLHPFLNRLQVASGLTCDKARANGDGPGDHARASAAYLTGVQPLKSDGQISLGMSADQQLARSLLGRSRDASLALSMDRGRTTGQCDSGYSCAYQNHISWIDDTRPATLHEDPAQLFQRLFRIDPGRLEPEQRARRDARRERLLNRTQELARSLAREAPASDRSRLEQYREGLEELRQRFASGGAPQVDAEGLPPGSFERYSERADAMGSVLALALEQDCAPVATWMLGQEGSNRRFDELGLDEGHHGLSHHQGERSKVDSLCAIDLLHTERLARFTADLAERPCRDSDLLAHTLIVFGSGIRDGNRHDHHDLPVLLLGGEALQLPELLGRRGRHVVHPRETPFAGLLAMLLDSFGAGRRSAGFGDAHGPLDSAGVEGL